MAVKTDSIIDELSEKELKSLLKIWQGTMKSLKATRTELHQKLAENDKLQQEGRSMIRKIEHRQEAIKVDNFKQGVFQKHGSRLSPAQREKVWSKAWDMGHSAGLHEVENYFLELVDLFE